MSRKDFIAGYMTAQRKTAEISNSDIYQYYTHDGQELFGFNSGEVGQQDYYSGYFEDGADGWLYYVHSSYSGEHSACGFSTMQDAIDDLNAFLRAYPAGATDGDAEWYDASDRWNDERHASQCDSMCEYKTAQNKKAEPLPTIDRLRELYEHWDGYWQGDYADISGYIEYLFEEGYITSRQESYMAEIHAHCDCDTVDDFLEFLAGEGYTAKKNGLKKKSESQLWEHFHEKGHPTPMRFEDSNGVQCTVRWDADYGIGSVFHKGVIVLDGLEEYDFEQVLLDLDRYGLEYVCQQYGFTLAEAIANGRSAVRKNAVGWVSGKVELFGIVYEYQAKVYDEGSIYGIGGGPVSKLHIKRESDYGWNREICSYERGWDIVPQDADVDVFSAVMEKLDPNFWDYAFESF